MQFSIEINRNTSWVFLIFLVLFFSPLSNPGSFEAGVFCGSKKQIISPKFIPDFISVMEKISSSVDDNQWGACNIVISPTEIYALGQCYGDLSPIDCSECFSRTRTWLSQCLPANSARIYMDGCFLRYDKYDFFKESVNSSHDVVKCGSPSDVANDVFMKEEFATKVEEVVSNVTYSASKKEGFAVTGERGGVEGVYALAQCWKTVDKEGCVKCLRKAETELKRCVPAKEGKALFTGCYLRYSTERFYSTSDSAVDDDSNKIKYLIAGIFSASCLFILALFGGRIGYKKLSNMKKMHINHSGISTSGLNSKFNFKYEMLEKATDYFDASRKLGQGGAGSVFKGILPDGRIVAVKRLFFTTRQWVDHFFNEVNLIGGIQHKNLVKLLGCSIEGPESLLVYEYVPNRSLDQILFDKNSIHTLSWYQRFDIICGIAEGLAYLHGGSGVKIIHRDIKNSNVLLDEHLIPKIADFGLARCLAPERTHVSTGIAGTLGYMAPEYLVRGQLTEKADVYAFGVMVLEIGCGRKNSIFTEGSNSILHSVWKNYKENHITDSIDPVLRGDFPMREASNVLQLGLLCTQASVKLRPSMYEVVQMLTDKECVIPTPKQPPFLNSSVLTADDSTGSTSMSYIASSGQFTVETSSFTVNSTSTASTGSIDRIGNPSI